MPTAMQQASQAAQAKYGNNILLSPEFANVAKLYQGSASTLSPSQRIAEYNNAITGGGKYSAWMTPDVGVPGFWDQYNSAYEEEQSGGIRSTDVKQVIPKVTDRFKSFYEGISWLNPETKNKLKDIYGRMTDNDSRFDKAFALATGQNPKRMMSLFQEGFKVIEDYSEQYKKEKEIAALPASDSRVNQSFLGSSRRATPDQMVTGSTIKIKNLLGI